ncbi:DUF4140 domain-containing protein [Rhodobacteraceae bacterium D3-12]|nr:DUF4140 domain-containing protein [Rhodobacteraceae bacterium D3-12]
MMRALPLVLAFFPSFALADDIMLSSRVSDVTLYPQGAKIVRMVPFEAPAGGHVLQLIDLPEGTPMETVRVKVTGAAMGAVKLRDDFVPPADSRETDAQKAARIAWEGPSSRRCRPRRTKPWPFAPGERRRTRASLFCGSWGMARR